jgi:hypothetical protein
LVAVVVLRLGSSGASLGAIQQENTMTDVTTMPRDITMNEFVELDGWQMVGNRKRAERRMLALYAMYPLPEFDENRPMHRLRKAYDDVTPFHRPLRAEVE